MLFSRGQRRGTENICRNKTPEVFFLYSTLPHFEAIITIFFFVMRFETCNEKANRLCGNNYYSYI
jgi:hypothetical protein